MEVFFKGVKLRLDFSFVLVVSFALLYGYQNVIELIIFSVLHEVGHLAALLLIGVKVKEIDLSFFGFGIKHQKQIPVFHEAIILACGPLVNLLLFLVFNDSVNAALFIINILPVYPLDGGRLLKLLFPTNGIKLSSAFLIISVIFTIYIFIKFGNYSLLLISLYLLFFNLRLV